MTKNLRSRFGNAVGQVAEAFVQGEAQVLLLEDAAELLAYRQRHFRSHEVEAEGQALSGSQRAGQHFQGIGQLGGEGFQPASCGAAAATSAAAIR